MKKIFILTIALFLLCMNIVSGTLDININVKDSFVTNEKVSFTYSIQSDIYQEITYIPYLMCKSAIVPPLQEEAINLTANKQYTKSYSGMVVDSIMETQTCTAYVQIIRPMEKKVSKNFSIKTDPPLDITQQICKDAKCKQKSKIFYLGQDIYLSYDLDVRGATVRSLLTLPDRTVKAIELPTLIKSEQIGTYELEVTASKEGYKTITKKEMFGVIEEQADIKDASFEKGYLSYVLIGIMIILIIAAVVLVWNYYRKKREVEVV